MKFLLRVLGTWSLGLALILLVIDGNKSLEANAFVATPLADLWVQFNPQSWAAVEGFVADNLAPLGLEGLALAVLSWPGIAVFAGLGILLIFVGRRRGQARYVQTH